MKILDELKNIIQKIFDFFIPDYCCLCEKINLTPDNNDDILCEKCADKVLFFSADKFENNLKDIEYVEKNFAMGSYEGKLRDLIIKFKYYKKSKIADYFAEQFNLRFLEIMKGFINKNGGEFLLIPVPLHQKRLKERGFNQSALFADLISKSLKIESKDIIKRIKNTRVQHNLNNMERADNLKDAFELDFNSIDRKYLNGKNVIIIDDIITTGATIKSMASLLNKNGVNKIWCFSISRAVLKQ